MGGDSREGARETLSVGDMIGVGGSSLPMELLILRNHIWNLCRVDTVRGGEI